MSKFQSTAVDLIYEGKLIRVGVEHFRHDDGDEVKREKVWHPGAVGILPVDSEQVWLTRQPREAVGEAASLEIPAGKLDVEGESPAQAGARELGEEIGKTAGNWQELMWFHTSPGFSDEKVWLYLATDLADDPDAEPDEHERIEIVPWGRNRLDEAIEQCRDSKSLIALLWLKSHPDV